MRKLAIAFSFALAFALSLTAAAATPNPSFVGTWIVSQGSMLPDGTAIPFELFSAPEFLHIDPDNEIRAVSGLFHASSRGTFWKVGQGRSLIVPVNASMGIGDWEYGSQGEVVFSYHAFIYDGSHKPIGYIHVIRTIDAPVGESPDNGAEDVLTGMAILQFFDLAGQPLALRMGEYGQMMGKLGGPFRAVRAATITLTH